MIITVASSLQGRPEEASPDDNLDTYRIGIKLFQLLSNTYNGSKIELLNREDYPGEGDAFQHVYKDINAMGANVSLHIHQDAGPAGARGYMVLYNPYSKFPTEAFAIMVRNEMEKLLAPLKVPKRGNGLQKRIPGTNGVGVLTNAQQPAILIECGFYTSAEDEAVGENPYAAGILNGVVRFIKEFYGVSPEGGNEMVFIKMDKLGVKTREDGSKFDVYGAATVGPADLLAYIDLATNTDVRIFFMSKGPDTDPNLQADWALGGYLNSLGVHGMVYNLNELKKRGTEIKWNIEPGEEGFVTIQVPEGSPFMGWLRF
jgi:hypothetical protein